MPNVINILSQIFNLSNAVSIFPIQNLPYAQSCSKTDTAFLKGNLRVISMDNYVLLWTDVGHWWNSFKVTLQNWNTDVTFGKFSEPIVCQNSLCAVKRLLEDQRFQTVQLDYTGVVPFIYSYFKHLLELQ